MNDYEIMDVSEDGVLRQYLILPDGYRLIFDENGYVGRYNPNLEEVLN